MKYFSMFSGIGGFELGIQQAFDNEYAHISTESEQKERSQGRERATDKPKVLLHAGNRSTPFCVGYSEIDKYAIKVYERQFEGHKNYGNATEINARELPDFDLLVGGFPCQAFSIAGKRAGFNDTRGTLFFDIARICAEKRPRHLVLENVKGLLSHDGGKTFQTILGVLADLGYFVEWQVLNSKDFGVPQNRERVFIVGHLGGEPRRKVFPIRQDGTRTTKGQSTISGEIQAKEQGTNRGHTNESVSQDGENGHIHQLNQPTHSNNRVYAESGANPTLNTAQGGNRQPFVAMRWNRTEKGKAYRREAQKNGRDLTPFNDGHRTLEPAKDKVIGTITSQAIAKDSLLGNSARIRRLTPLECERLQGFPDNWTALGVGDELISDTQRYKMCGNAVTVNVVEAVISKLLEVVE